jgi:hypothetical protein
MGNRFPLSSNFVPKEPRNPAIFPILDACLLIPILIFPQLVFIKGKIMGFRDCIFPSTYKYLRSPQSRELKIWGG